jgi:hypothetical protein
MEIDERPYRLIYFCNIVYIDDKQPTPLDTSLISVTPLDADIQLDSLDEISRFKPQDY